MAIKREKVLYLVCIFVIFPVICLSQGSAGNLIGWVIDVNGKSLNSAKIILRSPSLLGIRETKSNREGYFQFRSLPVGRYSVKVSYSNYPEIEITDVTIKLGKTTSLGRVSLQSIPRQKHVISVLAKEPFIDVSTTSMANNIDSDHFKSLPLDRNYRDMAYLIPQANISYYGDEVNISGSTGYENAYFIDGINVTDPYLGATGTNLPYNFIKEIEVKTAGFEAEFGRSLGGIVNVITHSGGNQFHGQAFGFFTNHNLAAKNRQGLLYENIDAYSTYDIGLSLGGPVIKDRLWFFGAYNPNYEVKDISIPGLGLHRDVERAHIFAGKLTWQATKDFDLVFTILGDLSTRNRIGTTYTGLIPVPASLANPDPYLGRVKQGGVNLNLQGKYYVNDKLLLVGSVSNVSRTLSDVPKTEVGRTEPLYADLLAGSWSGGYGKSLESRAVRTAAKLSASLFLGLHTLKAGIEFEDNYLDFLAENQAGTTGQDPSIIIRQAESSYLAVYSIIDVKVRNQVLSGFIQDSWQVSDKLNLYAGLRWDGQYLRGSNGKIAQSITNQWQPRLGFNLQLGEPGRQKIFGSYGRYYEQLSTHFPTSYYSTSINHYTWYPHNPIINPEGGYLQDISQNIYPEVSGLKGQSVDEYTLGYERRIGRSLKFGIKGTYRTLRQVIEDVLDPTSMTWLLGNPGEGSLRFFPKLRREYSGLQFSLEKTMGGRLHFLAAYVLSRTHGNYPGLFDGDFASDTPNGSPAIDIQDQLINGTGLLPNDRPHVIKLFGTYTLKSGLTIGTSFLLQSGTPRNEYGASWLSAEHLVLLSPRGTVGRTPPLWDLNFRIACPLGKIADTPFRPKFILDIFHLFSPRKPLSYDQLHFMALDQTGNQIGLNPNYGKVNLYQPPMMLRLGIEIDF